MNQLSPLESLFFAALEKGSSQERASYLDEACAADADLRQRVEKMLCAQADAGSFLEAPVAEASALDFAATAAMPPISERPGTVIGSYELLEQIGQGGFGVVFMAEQLVPVRRKVALKVIKPGMDTRQVIARFDAERQALAVMDHPNIAQVFEAGATESGRPYFVMELVRGLPITAYCDEHNLPVRDRLELFATVCLAIQHAHQKGIIHRDIKPTNVMVMRHDGRPVAKIIDFGISKAMGQPLTEKTLFTEFAQLVGTPLYMSPEQAELSSVDIDTRSDIYSLGVLLYELLTGSTPVNKEQLKQATFDEIRRIVREDDPLRPSLKISGSDALASIAAHRHIEPSRLSGLVRGELDWIVMKALEKERTRRYATASALAQDVEHYLHNEPVLAGPPSKRYRLRKLAARNKRNVIVAAGVALLLLLSLVTLAISNSRIRREQARTNQEKIRAQQAQRLAEGRADEIRQGLERLKTANALLERGRWYQSQQRWDDAHATFTRAIALRPDHATAWVERGDLFAWLGLWELASQDFAREFELREPDTTARWYRHALLRLYLGDAEGYRRACLRMHERFTETHDPSFSTELLRTSVLVADPEQELQPLLERAEHTVAGAPGTWYEQYVLGIALYRAGRYEQAAERLQQSLAGHPDWPDRALSYPVLAMACHRLGRAAEAQAALQSAAETFDRWTLEKHNRAREVSWVTHHGATAEWPVAWWNWLESQIYFREAKRLIDGSELPDDPRLIVLRARAFAGIRKNRTADVEYAAALKLLPGDSQVRMEAHRSAAYSAIGRRQWRRAFDEFTQAVQLAPDDTALWRCQAAAALAAEDVGAYRRVCLAMLERFEHDPARTDAYRVVWTCVLKADALPDMDRLLPVARIACTSQSNGAHLLGAALYRAGRYDESVEWIQAGARLYHPRAWDWSFLAMAHHRQGHTAEARRCLAEASRWIDEANRQTEDDVSGTRPVWGAWNEPVVCTLLLHEAEELLQQEHR